VSYDYDTNFYACTRLDSTDTTITDCTVAVSKGAIQAKQLYFCDMRQLTDTSSTRTCACRTRPRAPPPC